MRLIRHATLSPVPWKNGGGETAEIAVHPAGAGYTDFGWRISLARIAVSGPFSGFPGIDRTLTLVEGEGIVLTTDGTDHCVSPHSGPQRFSGDAVTAAHLLGGPVRDLNVMTRRQAFRHQVDLRHSRAGRPTPYAGSADATTILVLLGPCSVETPGERRPLERFDAVVLDAGEAVILAPADDIAIARILLRPLSEQAPC